MRFLVKALVSDMIYGCYKADNEDEARDMMHEEYGDQDINLCNYCLRRYDIGGLAVSDVYEEYEVETLEDGCFKVGALVSGMLCEVITADNEEEAREKMLEMHGGESINLCAVCSRKFDVGLSVSENSDEYEVELATHIEN